MRILALAIVLVLALAPVAYADFLTASPVGQGKMALVGTVLYDTDSPTAGITFLPIGVSLDYGITDALDVVGSASYLLYSGLAAGVSKSGFGYGVALKYTFLKEGKQNPVSLAGLLGYTGMSITTDGASATTSDIGGGILVSKVIENFVPYGGATYHSISAAGATSTAIQGNIGCAIGVAKDIAVLGEFNYSSMSTGGTTTSNSVFGLGVCWTM